MAAELKNVSSECADLGIKLKIVLQLRCPDEAERCFALPVYHVIYMRVMTNIQRVYN